MATLVNRNSSRVECLYYILQSVYAKFDTQKEFQMKDLKFDEDDENNTHVFCQLLEDGFVKYCPFLENQFDESKCYATRAIDTDTTKGKNVSDVVRTLEGFGFISSSEDGKSFQVTQEGERWIQSSYGSLLWQEIVDTAILSYGPFVGFAYKVKMEAENTVKPNQIYIGYPNTIEKVEVENDNDEFIKVGLSVGSKADSVVRSRSKFVSLGLTIGLWSKPGNTATDSFPHVLNREILNNSRLNLGRIILTDKFEEITSHKLYVAHPLSYKNLLKDVKALRENGSKLIREVTMEASEKVINRRFVIVDILNRASKNDFTISFRDLLNCMEKHGENFFIESDNTKWSHILQSELDIAFLAGLPFEVITSDGIELKPLTIINEDELRKGAPASILKLSDQIWEEVKK